MPTVSGTGQSLLNRAAVAVALGFLLSLAPALAQTELIVNGGAELGGTGWSFSGGAGWNTQSYGHTGTNCLLLGGNVNQNDSISQTISIPASATNVTYTFYYNIYSTEALTGAYDTLDATIQDTLGNVLATVGSWSNLNKDPAPGNPYYHLQTYNLVAFAGQTVQVVFSSANDFCNPTYFLIDDVSVKYIAPLVPPANDSCAGAVAMTAGTTYTVNTAQATSAGDPTPACQPSFGKGVWYTFTPSSSTTVTISTCGSDFNTVLAVYTGSCGSLTQIACNDDNGPACSGNQASVSFAATAGTTYYVLAGGLGGATGNLSILATGGTSMKIIPTFDSSITSDPQAATIEATINSAIALYQSSFSDPITVNITFQKSTNGVGHSSTYYNTFSYANYRAALVSHATSADDATALAHLPVSANNPVTGDLNMNLHLSLARAMGFSADPPTGQPDSTISLNISNMNLSLSVTNPNKYSLYSAVCHEIDEVLGFSSALNGLNNGDPAPTGPVSPEDLFRYDAIGARSFTTASNAASYFSLDGTTDLARFNQYQTGDFQDWYSYYGGQTPQVQDAFGTKGTAPLPGVEFRVLDAIGYTRIIASPTLTLVRSGTNVVITWPASYSGFALQSATNLGTTVTWAPVSPAPTNIAGFYTVTNSLSGGRKFYRLLK
jgi:hypothetical protein